MPEHIYQTNETEYNREEIFDATLPSENSWGLMHENTRASELFEETPVERTPPPILPNPIGESISILLLLSGIYILFKIKQRRRKIR